MAETTFVNGLIFKLPHERAPDFVRGKISVKVEEFIEFAREHQDNGWLNIQLKVSKGGKAYAELDTWKPDNKSSGEDKKSYQQDIPSGGEPFNDDIPFLQASRFMVI